jgi:phosphoserine phosphatase
MGGSVKFEDALAARLSIIKPSKDTVQDFASNHEPVFSDGVEELIKYLHDIGVSVFLVSGGFRLVPPPLHPSSLVQLKLTLHCSY